MTFNDLEFGPHPDMSGVQAIVFFPNGYGVSVIKGDYSYGGRNNLYELAILAGTEDDWDLSYDSGITDDVVGHLTEANVTYYLERIIAL